MSCSTRRVRGGVILLCGRSFSGKSTVAAHLVEAFAAHLVSLDSINDERGLWGGDGIAVAEWARTMDIARERVRAAIAGGALVVVDDTSSPAFLRDAWRELAAVAAVPSALVYVDASHDTIASRLAANRTSGRRRDVRDAVMDTHLDGFEPPRADEAAIVVDSGVTDRAQLVRAVQLALEGDPPPATAATEATSPAGTPHVDQAQNDPL